MSEDSQNVSNSEPEELQVHAQVIVAQESFTSPLILELQCETNCVVRFIFCHPNYDQVDKTHYGWKALEVSKTKATLSPEANIGQRHILRLRWEYGNKNIGQRHILRWEYGNLIAPRSAYTPTSGPTYTQEDAG